MTDNQNPNLGFDTMDEPVCFKSFYQSGTGKNYDEYFLNEYATNVLAASYNPVITRKIIKLIKELKKVITKQLSPAEQLLSQAQLMVEQERRLNAINATETEWDQRN